MLYNLCERSNMKGKCEMFLTVKEIRKHFGEGDSRVEVLNGIDAEIEKEKYAYCSVRPARASPPF